MEEIIKILAKKYNLSEVAISAIVESPFRFMDETLNNEDFQGFNFEGLGKLLVKKTVGPDPKTYYQELVSKRKALNAKSKKHSRGVEESNLGHSSSGGDSQDQT